MKIIQTVFIALPLLFCACQDKIEKESATKSHNVKEINFYTPDSIKIFGDLYTVNKEQSTILLFHQGGSNARGEYGPIIPKLVQKDFNVLAIDLRSGGQYYGSYNRTLANIPTNRFGDGYGYCDAYNNLESALDFVNDSGFSGHKIIWGSSYSATLAIQLANNRPNDIAGVLAFSPASGGSMKNCLPDVYFETLKLPLLLLRPPNEMKSENSILQFELAKTYNHQTFVPQYGVHGSSMLVEDRVGNNVDETWDIVFSFLKAINKE